MPSLVLTSPLLYRAGNGWGWKYQGAKTWGLLKLRPLLGVGVASSSQRRPTGPMT